MKQIIESLEKEIKDTLQGKMPEKSQSYANGYIAGLYHSIDAIKLNAATSVVESSIMHGSKNKDLNGEMKCITICYELHIKSVLDVEDLENKVQQEVEQLLIANSDKIEGIVYSINSK